ncbi:FAD-dependent oxidoreductase (plasmid) [Deinococcus taeanensis]|uniref:dihydrolipoyl dehydrogenase family protein n=1 Tax=Deinococcus taeanensis TaxID=2737050 RepID=UPI001CDB793E|nr:FAD-dependent oxidoreductase [Deinococcus taeanensis]UBV44581.1 FAD-dependent oxidoreductase [Deinococcus taeanensis]
MTASPAVWNVPCALGETVMTVDVAVLGGGAAGLTAAQVAVTRGQTVILIERDRLGGECLFTGCVPSKTLLSLARRVHTARSAEALGLAVLGPPSWAAVQAALGRTIGAFQEADSPHAVQASGVRVVNGEARFVAPRTLELQCQGHTHQIVAGEIVLATGSHPVVPPIEGLTDLPYLTTETLFDLPEAPAHLLILGGGPVGCEMAQAFVRLGSDVTLIQSAAQLLPRDEPEAARHLLQVLRADGVTVHLNAQVQRLRGEADGIKADLDSGGTVTASHVLLATGKRPNVENLGLERIGAAYDEHGLTVDAQMRSTTVPYLSGAGDVVGGPMFTHGATERGTLAGLGATGQAGRLLARARAPGAQVERIPWVTFTSPEIAHWGLTEADAVQKYGRRVIVVDYDYRHLDRAITEGEAGFVKLIALQGRLGTPLGLRVVGAQVVGGPAGELAQLLSMPGRLGIHPLKLALLPAPYPTYAEAVRQTYLGLFTQGRAFGVRRPGRR